MANTAERTHVMKEHFMTLHQQGYSIKEIATKFNLSSFTVYYHLQEIADENGVSRDSLLQVVRAARTQRQLKEEERRVQVNFEELIRNFQSSKDSLKSIINSVKEILEEEQK